MEKMLAIVFDDREKAYEGVRALSALDAEASLILNRLAVIRKNLDGTVSISVWTTPSHHRHRPSQARPSGV